MFVLSPSNLPYFGAWVVFGLLNGFWLSLALRSYHRAAQHASLRGSSTSRSIWHYWLDIFGPARVSSGEAGDPAKTLVLKRRVRISAILFAAWIVIGNLVFFLG